MNYSRSFFIMVSFLLGAGIFSVYIPDKSLSENSFQQENIQQGYSLISVYDNYQVDKELKPAWGFATVIKTHDETLLFDTGGSSEILLFNMKKMNIDPQSIDKIIISHIHADHLGGLKGFLEKNNNVMVFIPSYFPDSIRNMIISQGAELTDVSGPQKISESVYSSGDTCPPFTSLRMVYQPFTSLWLVGWLADLVRRVYGGLVRLWRIEFFKVFVKPKEIYCLF